jgi:hypothetical protein
VIKGDHEQIARRVNSPEVSHPWLVPTIWQKQLWRSMHVSTATFQPIGKSRIPQAVSSLTLAERVHF